VHNTDILLARIFNLKKSTGLCFGLLIAVLSSKSQSVFPATINTSGSSTSSAGYQFEWSVGESTSIVTMTRPNLVVTSGILQAAVPYTPADNYSVNWLAGEIKIYPNPTRDILEIKLMLNLKGTGSLEILDLLGRKLMDKQFDHYGTGTLEKWDLSSLVSGQYVLQVHLFNPVTGKTIKKGSFKIQKIK